ncbi:Alpha/Beta hydrolase protein [Podospora australis]|uniref:Alpha/Beta hydrolase protein n=1 Tax=Podospora australis TaxID=1536484 RepID=A0AAN7AGK0_9PEZI|nr:Alpha/Beta hydrolase protein [Podospora australis]
MSSITSKKSKFHAFSREDYVYSTVEGHDLWTSVWSPTKTANTTNDLRTAPVLVFWHGGGFIVGDRLYEPWWPTWLLELALSQNALIVAPDYRLLPEASGADIADDVDAFWSWFLEGAPSLSCNGLQPDLDRVICAGHSAGGTLALMSALERPDANVKAVVSLYGPLDDSVPALKIARPRPILGSRPPPPRQAETIIRNYVMKTRGTTRSTGSPSEMWGLVACILQQGRLPRMFGRRPDPRLELLGNIEKGRVVPPPMWIVHGMDDSVVSPSCSMEFVRRVEAVVEDPKFFLSLRDGEHNFDASLGMEEGWVKEGCEFLLGYW